ncbi:MAG TPA: carbohydrate kinase [Terriglobia bacterium]|nr:carbohydrate kinase [Terriglobia bacterium]
MKIISVGEILWDVFDHGEYLGGAPFNFAVHAQRLGHDVSFVSAVGNDERGNRALARIAELGLSPRFVQCIDGQPTGIASVSLDALGQPQFVIHRPAAYDFVSLDECAGISSPEADWIYFGTLHQQSANARGVLDALIEANPRAHRFYDVNLRPSSYDAPLVRDLLKRASVAKLNHEEAVSVAALLGQKTGSIEGFCRDNAKTFGWEAVVVTRGAEGCVLLISKDYAEVPGYSIQVADTVGAGDGFAAAFLHGLSQGWPAVEIGDFANRVAALIASRAGGAPAWSVDEALALSAPSSRS